MILQRYKKFNHISEILKENDIEYKNDGKFSTAGVSGFVGKLFINNEKGSYDKKEDNTIVYKMSSDVDFIIDHESFVLSELNKLNIPHFCKYYKIKDNINILSKINKSKSKILLMEHLYSQHFKEKEECKTFYNILHDNKDIGSKGRNIISSQILQILMALEISQNELSFTHYDLHMDNILELKCEYNSVFLYNVNDEYFVVPTFGYYPVLIDVGMSYIYDVNDRPMFSSIHNYINGSQCAIFDTLNDIHHLLISSFYYIEDCSEDYENISDKLKSIFSNIPVLRKRGWKQLKNNIVEKTVDKIKTEIKYFNDQIFDNNRNDLVGLLAGLIILPLKDKTSNDEFNSSFTNFFKEIKYIYNLFDLDDDYLLLNIVKVIVSSIIYMKENDDKKEEFENELVKNLKYLSRDFKSKLEIEKLQYIHFNYLYSDGIDIGIQLSNYFYKLVIENTSIIQKGYQNIEEKYEISSPINFFTYFYENLTPYFKIDNDTLVYTFENNIQLLKLAKI